MNTTQKDTFSSLKWICECTEMENGCQEQCRKNNRPRFVLGQLDENSMNTLLCIGVNPSTAIPNDLDPTLKRVKKHAENSGYDSWIMVNLYPQRATDPNKLDSKPDRDIAARNAIAIKAILDRVNRADIWCAWGQLINKRAYLLESLTDILDAVKQSGSTKELRLMKKDIISPPHPLSSSLSNNELTVFDINNYVDRLKASKKQY